MNNPEIKRLSGLEAFVYIHDGGRGLQVHLIRGRDEPPVRYAEVQVRAFDEANAEIAVVPGMPQEKNFMGGVQSTGFYFLTPKEGQRVASVEVARRGEKETFKIAPAMVAPPLKLPVLHGQEAFVDVYHEGEDIDISLRIFKKEGDPEIRYSEFKLRAFDETGAEVPASQANPREATFSGPGNGRGKYLLGLKEGQRVVSVELTRGGEKQTFSVTHELKTEPRM